MTSPSSTRLERALELFVSHEQQGGDWGDLLHRHPDLAELLESFRAEDTLVSDGAERLGDFELLREVGVGGAGVVHEARQRSLGRRVALKLLHQAFAASPTALARFRREAQTLARLDHDGIVRVFAVGENDGRHWLAMEFVDGEPLAAHLDRLRREGGHRGESRRRLVEIVAGIAIALQHAHEAGIVHRDVKPSNILLRSDATAVLGDFGLARDADDPGLTQTGVVAGTPNYMAPEQIVGRGADCDARTDVFALGATLYECLTLRPPFAGETAQHVLQAILTREPADPRRLDHGLPTELAAITLQALEKEPARRYQSAQEMACDLRAFLELRPVAARPPTRTQRFVRLLRRRPLVAAMLLLAATTTALGGALLWQLPEIRAAAAAHSERRYEDAVLSGMLARTGSDAAACYAHFERALEEKPDGSEALAGLALSIRHFETPERALQELERRTATVPGGTDVDFCRALLLRRVGRAAEAEALERRLGEPWTPMALWLTAASSLGEGTTPAELRHAEGLLARGVLLAPQPRLLMFAQWAVVLKQLGDEERCVEVAEAMLRLWPGHPYAASIAAACILTTQPERAVGLLRDALEHGVQDPLARLNLAIALHRCNRIEDAVATYRAGFDGPGLTDPQRTTVLDLLHQCGAESVAQDLVEQWIARSPANPAALRYAARNAMRRGDVAAALESLRRAHAARPADFDVRADLAFALLETGEIAEAGDLLRRLATEQPRHEWVHGLLLDACMEGSDAAGAIAELQRWAGLHEAEPRPWRDLAEALLGQDDGSAAQQALLAAERADYAARGADPELWLLRASVHEKLGQRDLAQHLRTRAAAAARGEAGPVQPQQVR